MLEALCRKFALERGINLKPALYGKEGTAYGVSIDYYFFGPHGKSLVMAKRPECEVTVFDVSAPDDALMLVEITRGFLPDYLAMLSRSSEEINQTVLREFSWYVRRPGHAIDNLSELFSIQLPSVSPLVDCLFPPGYTKTP